MIATGSWDSTVALHDPRAGKPQVASFNQPERVYHMDAVKNTLVVAMGGRKINIYDVRKMEKPMQERDSSLRFMTRALACMPSGDGMAILPPVSPAVTDASLQGFQWLLLKEELL